MAGYYRKTLRVHLNKDRGCMDKGLRTGSRAKNGARVSALTSLLAVLLLTGCSDKQRFSFEGAADDFCVPNDYVIEGPIWLTPDVVDDDGGLAFQGCGLGYQGNCDFPEIISSGTLGPIPHARGHKWGDFHPHTEPRESTLEGLSNHTYRLIEDESKPGYRILAVHSRLMGATGAYYWRIAGEGNPRLDPSSELLAECGGVNDKRSPDAPEVAYQCARTTLMKDAAIHYTFLNGTINTAFVTHLDSQVFAGVNKWRCKKKA